MTLASMLLGSAPPADTGGTPDPTPTVPGTAYAGGYYVGRIKVGADTYAIILAPKATGEDSSFTRVYKADTTTFTGNTSTFDGWSIRNAMVAQGINLFPAAKFCYDLRIGGFDDWYLPSRDELEICYRYLKPTTGANVTTAGANTNAVPTTTNYTISAPVQTTATIFRASAGAERFASDYYWTASNSGNPNDPGKVIRMTTGQQPNVAMNDTYYIRAVRRVLIAA